MFYSLLKYLLPYLVRIGIIKKKKTTKSMNAEDIVRNKTKVGNRNV